MARNGSGTYSVTNTFVSSQPITASSHNANWTDAGNEITNSIAADGQTTMTGQLKGYAGTVSAPGIGFALDLDCGMYRIGANNIGLAVNGTKILDIGTTGLTVIGALNGDTSIFMPSGSIIAYAGSAAPTAWLLCNGSSILRASYPNLFTAIGTTYGSADGSHFTLPDLTGRIIAGKEASASRLTFAVSGIDGGTLGAVGGVESRTITQGYLPNVTLTTTIGSGQGSHGHAGSTVALQSNLSGTGSGAATQGGGSTGLSIAAATLPAMSGTTPLGGSGVALPTAQPTIVLNYIIKI
jgi:microcystin-dependent protein